MELIEHKKDSGCSIVFSVGNTRVYDDSNFYLTPIRVINDLIISGIVVFSENEGAQVFSEIDGVVDYIFVDCEKKSKNNDVGLFNLERLAVEKVQHSKLNFYKGNDITVNSIDTFLFTFFKKKNALLGGKNLLVIGIGNIGFKISLKLVERGATIHIKSRDVDKSEKVCEVLNAVKPKETISTVELYSEELDVLFDAVILTHLRPLKENDSVFVKLHPETLVLDVGKGCLSAQQVEMLRKREIEAYRLDVGDVFVNTIVSAIRDSTNFKLPCRKRLNSSLSIIEPGIIGLEDEVVVNSVEQPSFVYGVCDGRGGFKRIENLQNVLYQIKNENNINYGL